MWGAWHAASRQHHNVDSVSGGRASPPAKGGAWHAFLLDLEPTDPEWDARQQGSLLLQGLLTSRYPAPGSFGLLPVAASSEDGPAAAGGPASGSQGAGAALRLLAKHVENRGAALVHQAEDLALEVQRRWPVSMRQGVH